MARPITIKVTGDDRDFRRSMSRVEGSIGKMSGSVTRMAGVVGGALAAAGIAKFGTDDVTLASDLGEAASAAETVFGEAFAQVEDALSDSATAMGLNRAEAFDLANGIGVLFKNVEDAERATIALDLASRAADIGSMFNEEPDVAAAALTSALNGSSETVRRFGIDTSDAAIKAFALKNGIEAVGGQLSEDQKKMIRYQIIMEDSSIAAGNFADTSDGLANQQRILSAQFEELQIRLGEKLLPVISSLAGFIIDEMVPAAELIGGYLQDTFGPVVERIAGFIQDDLIPAFQNISGTVDGDVHPIVARLVELWNDALKPAFDDLAAFVDEHLLPALADLWRIFNDDIRPVLEDYIIPIMIEVADIMLTHVLPAVLELAGFLIDTLVFSIELVIESFKTAIDFVEELIGVFEDMIDFLIGLPAMVGDALSGLWDSVPRPPGFITDFAGDVGGFLGFARGGTTSQAGMALVGERGPELVRLPAGTEVVPNHDLNATAQSGVVVNVQTQADPFQIGREVAWAIRTAGV